MQEGVGFAVFQKVARTPGETVDQPPLLPSLKRLFDHLEGAPPVVAVHLVGHCEEDAHQLVNRLGKAIVGIVGAAQHALGDSVFLVAPGIASGLVHHTGKELRSAEGRVGKGWGGTGRSWWWLY